MIVVGIQEKKGSYQGNTYHNYLIHCLKDDDNALGQISEVIKVKASRTREIFGRTMELPDLDDLIGNTIRCYYDRYGQASEIRIVDSPDTASK